VARSTDSRRKALRLGHRAEWIVILYLALKGYRILARRYLTKGGEIDVIALRGKVVAFIEVKARSDRDAGLEAISSTKIHRFAQAVDGWLMRNGWASTYTLRCDAVIVVSYRLPYHIEDAFELPLA
jgi:putative endonuclease